jgi:hypothetical protein
MSKPLKMVFVWLWEALHAPPGLHRVQCLKAARRKLDMVISDEGGAE